MGAQGFADHGPAAKGLPLEGDEIGAVLHKVKVAES